MADSVTPVSRSKKATKNCSFCGAEQPIARKQCSECFTHFPKVQKSLEKIKQMGQTNVTQQRKLMEKRADILNVRHNCDVIIIMKNRHGDGDSLNVYGTAGAGVTSIGNKSTVKPSEGGAVTLQLFDRFLRDFYRSQTGSLPSTADDGPDSNPTESENSTASTPNTQSTAITQIGSATAIQTDETPPVSSCNTSNKDSNSESGNSATCTASTPNTQSTANTQSSCSATAIQTDETPPVSSSISIPFVALN